MNKWVLAGSASVLLIGVTAWIYLTVSSNRADADLKEQLRLARLEGIPTTAAEFAALIKPCRPEDNAAPYYRHLKPFRGKAPDPVLTYNLIVKPNSAAVHGAESFVKANQAQYAAIDQAVKKPHCWFNRDWSQGFAVLFPEYTDMKAAAKLLAFRASLEVVNGKPEAALADIESIQVIGRHLREEPNMIAGLVSDSARTIAIKDLAEWSYMHPDVAQFREALRKAIKAFSPPEDKAEHIADLYSFLLLLDAAKTPEGLKSLGVNPGDLNLSWHEKLTAAAISRGKNEADIVAAHREMWAAYSFPPGKRDDALKKATDQFIGAAWSVPVVAKLFFSLSDGGDEYWTDHRWKAWKATREAYVAAYRALASRKVPLRINTSDLRSPFDGKPLGYKFDGKQITISVSGYGEDETPPTPLLLKIPPDPPSSKN